jgi:hypothetical protein
MDSRLKLLDDGNVLCMVVRLSYVLCMALSSLTRTHPIFRIHVLVRRVRRRIRRIAGGRNWRILV